MAFRANKQDAKLGRAARDQVPQGQNVHPRCGCRSRKSRRKGHRRRRPQGTYPMLHASRFCLHFSIKRAQRETSLRPPKTTWRFRGQVNFGCCWGSIFEKGNRETTTKSYALRCWCFCFFVSPFMYEKKKKENTADEARFQGGRTGRHTSLCLFF